MFCSLATHNAQRDNAFMFSVGAMFGPLTQIEMFILFGIAATQGNTAEG